MRTTVGIMLLVACLLAPVAAQGYVVIVDQSGGGASYTTITEGLAAALPGDHVRVKGGTYSASTGETMPIMMRSGVRLAAHSILHPVVIDGEGLTRAMKCVNLSSSTEIRHIIFAGGAAVTGDEHGGGMWLGDFDGSHQPRIEQCTFRDNYANQFGGGLYADASARHSVVTHCRFSNNTALNGGGVCAVGNGPIGLRDCVFDGNSVTGYGGGLLIIAYPTDNRDPSRLCNMSEQTYVGNSADLGGAAISTNIALYLFSTIIAFNTSLNDPIICHESGIATLSCCDVFGNAGGDYVGSIAGQLGVNGNIWNNPEFCGEMFEPDDPYSINVSSACADDNNGPDCSQIGARPVGCGIPYLYFNFEWLEYYIPFGEECCHTLIFGNGGDLALDWQIFAYEGVLGRGSGGPDGYGYRWTDSDEASGPTFYWEDISSYGTPVVLGDDDATLVALPFTFPFYDTSWFEFALSSNGYLTFGSDWTASVNGPIPDSTQPNEFIAPFWEDLDPSAGGTIHYYYDAAAGTFTVQFTEVPNASSAVGGEYTFQVVLYNDGTIRFYYLSMVGYVEGATIGIENPDGTIGLQVAYNEPYIHDDLAVIIDLGPPPDWFWMSLTEGTLRPGDEAMCECCANASDLEGGIYEATLVLVSNDFNDPVRYIPITMEIFPTGIDDEMSTRLTLRGNYPNPFNPGTKIAFELPEPARVNLRVYSAAGRLVRSLLEGVAMGAGPHAQPWDGRDDGGRVLASGVYFCRLEADGEALSRSMVLLK
jgi:hypothetical protein